MCGLAIAFAHAFIAPETLASAVVFLAVAVSALIAIAAGRGRASSAWGLLLAGAGLMVVGDALWVLSVLVLLRMRDLLRRVQRQTEELARLATIDPLTGVANRRCWNHEIARFIADAQRRDHPLSVALVDLDHLKRYNDANGHLAGDNLLIVSATRWRELLRASDFLARYGGEEFAIALPGTTACAAVAVPEPSGNAARGPDLLGRHR